MKMLFDRILNGKETIKDPLYDNPYSYGRILVSQDKCDSCGSCQKACIVDAIRLSQRQCLVDEKKCIYCKKCLSVCPNQALYMTNDYKMAELEQIGETLKGEIYTKFNRALTLRSVDTGSCNACMLELSAAQNTYYDLSRFGISFAASPRHADGIVVTGPVTTNMKEALEKTYFAMAQPRLVIAVGTCAHDGGIYKQGYGNYESLNKIIPVSLVIPGCPPSPQAILFGLLKLMDKLVP